MQAGKYVGGRQVRGGLEGNELNLRGQGLKGLGDQKGAGASPRASVHPRFLGTPL